MQKVFNELYSKDLLRYDGKIRGYMKKYLYFFRKTQTCHNRFQHNYYKFFFKILSEKHGMEIPWNTLIGGGLCIPHPFNITIHERSRLGENITINKGAVIGKENRGKRKGVPTIGNKVWIGINSSIVGNITIGDDVLIAPNSFVNCDIPSHSIVLGNPCKIFFCENATRFYINL